MERKTPLYHVHQELKGRMVEYAGFMLPVQYEAGIAKEHNAVRKAAGIFDVSHMGEFILEGENALQAVSRLVCNFIEGMKDGQVRYSPMLNERGGVVDDLLIYRMSSSRLMLVVNAANREKDFAWIQARLPEGTAFEDISDRTGLIALQGPRSAEILEKLIPRENIPSRPYTFANDRTVAGKRTLVSRTGYTGEDGFEFYVAWEDAPAVFEALLEAGDVMPCGLGARDTLRLEAAMPLYGHEMDEQISPLETGLGAFVKMETHDFIGRQALLDRGAPALRRVGLELTDRGIARENCLVYDGETRIGRTTSGTMSPYTGKSIAMALVDAAFEGGEVAGEVRGRMLGAKTVPLPFYKRRSV